MWVFLLFVCLFVCLFVVVVVVVVVVCCCWWFVCLFVCLLLLLLLLLFVVFLLMFVCFELSFNARHTNVLFVEWWNKDLLQFSMQELLTMVTLKVSFKTTVAQR